MMSNYRDENTKDQNGRQMDSRRGLATIHIRDELRETRMLHNLIPSCQVFKTNGFNHFWETPF